MKSNPFRLFAEYYYKWSVVPKAPAFHSHPQYEVYYFHEGRCDYLLGDRVIPLQSGDLIIMNGMTRHCPKVERESEYVRTMFSFEPHLVQLFGPDLLACDPLKPFERLRNHHIRLDPKAKEECEDILARINRFYYSNDVVHRNRLLSAFYDLLMLIYEQCRPEMKAARQPASDRQRYVQSMIDYIEETYMENIELERMAADLHMNRFHLMKVFREVTGMTVFDYLYKRRVNQAKILFYQSDRHSVTDVGYQVGFKHLSHFSRVFKKQVGMTPDQYRKMVRESTRWA
ncbi:helix-turn-helix transcriptional regulator [Paenibacillus sp. GYB003]|uniref:helix-turn-helix transcriptional regulator n=1 Tax=Paenibacillus sp. GYB003 TaxID=2994392 RepID=UPI002F964618